VGTEEVVLIDPGSPYADEHAAVDRAIESLHARGRRIVEIWLTHHHLDHVGDCERLAQRLGVPVAAHAATAQMLAGRVAVDRHLSDGDRRTLAGEPRRALRVWHTPGHAPGHLCVLEEVTGAAVVGDLVATWGTILIDPSEGDMGAYLESLTRVRDAAPRLLLPAHGGAVVAVREKLDAYIAHRLWREERVCDALRAHPGARPSELVEGAYDDVDASLHALAERSLRAHLAKLEAEGRARRSGDTWDLPD
jgi:glyoxylase-like metal-dependent hydrolase (beta-lactamase superfamily II)